MWLERRGFSGGGGGGREIEGRGYEGYSLSSNNIIRSSSSLVVDSSGEPKFEKE